MKNFFFLLHNIDLFDDVVVVVLFKYYKKENEIRSK